VYGTSTAPFLSFLANKLVDMSGDPRQRQWLHQRLSLGCGQRERCQHIGLVYKIDLILAILRLLTRVAARYLPLFN